MTSSQKTPRILYPMLLAALLLESAFIGYFARAVVHRREAHACAVTKDQLEAYKHDIEGFKAGYDTMLEKLLLEYQDCVEQRHECERKSSMN